jgi:glycosyltransferase involved in cell wall biosynthesis
MAEPIRVLEVVVSTGLGGGPAHLRDLVAGLPAGEFEVTIAGPAEPGPATWAPGSFVPLATDRLALSGTVSRLAALIRERGIRVVHSHGKGAGLYGRLAAARTGAAAVHTFHGLHHEAYPPGLRRAYLALERWLARRSHTLIHVSASQAREAERLGLAPAGRSRVIVNGVDAARVRELVARAPVDRRALDLPPRARVVATVARLDPVKRLEVLVEAFALARRRCPEAVLLVVGDGRHGPALRRRAARLGIQPWTVWPGPIPDAVRCLPAVDVYASASRREGLPLGVLEAMACGLPVVATRVTGHVDLVDEGRSGLLCPPDDPPAMAEALVQLLADPARARALGEAGRRRAEESFGAARMAAETARVYREAAAFPGRGAAGAVV